MTVDRLVDAYWRYFELSNGDRVQRLESESLLWAVDDVSELIHGESDEAIGALVALADGAPGTPGLELLHDDALLRCLAFLGAGPVEDLIEVHGEALVGPLDEAARTHPRFQAALRCAWFDEALSAVSVERLRRHGELL